MARPWLGPCPYAILPNYGWLKNMVPSHKVQLSVALSYFFCAKRGFIMSHDSNQDAFYRPVHGWPDGDLKLSMSCDATGEQGDTGSLTTPSATTKILRQTRQDIHVAGNIHTRMDGSKNR